MTSARLEAPSRGIKARWSRWLAIAMLCGLAGIAPASYLAERFQEFMGSGVMTADIAAMPTVDAALVLGTSRLMPDGGPNITFDNRLDAAAMLWKAGKVKYLIVSGNHTGAYDEPSDMRAGLIARGVPADVIYRDGRGYRTWLSVIHAREVFGLRRFAIVSQRSHVARALFLARSLGLDAFGFEAAEDPTMSTVMRLRAYPAAVLSYYDAWRGLLPPRRPYRAVAIGIDSPN